MNTTTIHSNIMDEEELDIFDRTLTHCHESWKQYPALIVASLNILDETRKLFTKHGFDVNVTSYEQILAEFNDEHPSDIYALSKLRNRIPLATHYALTHSTTDTVLKIEPDIVLWGDAANVLRYNISLCINNFFHGLKKELWENSDDTIYHYEQIYKLFDMELTDETFPYICDNLMWGSPVLFVKNKIKIPRYTKALVRLNDSTYWNDFIQNTSHWYCKNIDENLFSMILVDGLYYTPSEFGVCWTKLEKITPAVIRSMRRKTVIHAGSRLHKRETIDILFGDNNAT